MMKPITLITNLPFDGFYESDYSAAIDSEETQFAEYLATECDREGGELSHPEPLRLSADDLAGILFDVTTYHTAYQKIAESYVEAFESVVSDRIGFPLGLKFESMTSPKFYNFETDRVFAHVPLKTVRKLFALSKEKNHATLAKVIAERFTSCSGFSSFYSNDLADWLEKPLRDWDHNEIGTLVIAALRQAAPGETQDAFERALYEATFSSDAAHAAWSSAVDWTAFEEKRNEARAEKRAGLRETDPEAFALLLQRESRDDRTPDLFA
jgi:hypothetical protein